MGTVCGYFFGRTNKEAEWVVRIVVRLRDQQVFKLLDMFVERANREHDQQVVKTVASVRQVDEQ